MYSNDSSLIVNTRRDDLLREAHNRRLARQAQPASNHRHPIVLRILLALLLVRPH